GEGRAGGRTRGTRDDFAVWATHVDGPATPGRGRPHEDGEWLVETVVRQAVVEHEPQHRQAVLASPRMPEVRSRALANVQGDVVQRPGPEIPCPDGAEVGGKRIEGIETVSAGLVDAVVGGDEPRAAHERLGGVRPEL